MTTCFSVLAYLGPNEMMPVASIFAAIVGAIVLMWQRVVGWFRATFARCRGLFVRGDD